MHEEPRPDQSTGKQDDDEQHLHALGYGQELARRLSGFSKLRCPYRLSASSPVESHHSTWVCVASVAHQLAWVGPWWAYSR